MFLDKKESNVEPFYVFDAKPKRFSRSLVIFLVVFAFIIVASIFLYFYIKNKDSYVVVPVIDPILGLGATSTTGILPIYRGSGNGIDPSLLPGDVKAELLSFGYFYKKEEDNFVSTLDSYELPINLKTDVANYYDISRKINIDDHVDNLNQYGYSVIDNRLKDSNNFYDAYRELLSMEIPVVITTDFMMYYYQNQLKQLYKQIEQTSFYDNLWELSKRMYDLSLVRYKKRMIESGVANDPILEAERLEVAFFAVALKTLIPREKQMNDNANFNDESKFTLQEAEYYSFELPEYLRNSVIEKEVDLIVDSKDIVKSPVFMYAKDYSGYTVPEDYLANAKLSNFYQAMKWYNSVFPLYYLGDYCPDCLLDNDDWIINLAAASFISKDFSENQDIKNQWAIIYKFISYFSGLRQDLTYLHYDDVLKKFFGEEYDVIEIFGSGNSKRNEDLVLLQKELTKTKFSELEGTYNRESNEARSMLGMRLLQEPYWPNGYIFSRLTGDELEKINQDKNDRSITKCNRGDLKRCQGFGYDVINLIDKDIVKNDYITSNIGYKNYDLRINELRNTLSNFDVFTWNSNVYWSTLDIGKSLLAFDNKIGPAFSRSDKWTFEREYNSILGAWVNLHLPLEQLNIYQGGEEGKDVGLSGGRFCSPYNYIEPNIEFVRELIAKNKALEGMITALKATRQTNLISSQLEEYDKELKQILNIIKKELSGKGISEGDCDFIKALVKNYTISGKVESKSYSFPGLTKQKIDGIKLLSLVHLSEEDNKKVMAIGPIFNYQEY